MNCKRCDRRFTRGERVEVRNMPWKGIIATYIGPAKFGGFHRLNGHPKLVELGDVFSGGSPRRVKVTHIEKLEEATS